MAIAGVHTSDQKYTSAIASVIHQEDQNIFNYNIYHLPVRCIFYEYVQQPLNIGLAVK